MADFTNTWLLNVYKLALLHGTPPDAGQLSIKTGPATPSTPSVDSNPPFFPAGSTTCNHPTDSPSENASDETETHQNFLLHSYSTVMPASNPADAGVIKSLRSRVSSLTTSRDSLVSTCSDLTAENRNLRWKGEERQERLGALVISLAEEQAAVAALNSSIEKQHASHSAALDELSKKHDEATEADKQMITSLLDTRTSSLKRIRELESKLIEIESFMGSDKGRDATKMEAALAETKLRLALAQAERDELEIAVLENSQHGTEKESDTGSICGSDYWEWKRGNKPKDQQLQQAENSLCAINVKRHDKENAQKTSRKVFGVINSN
jgi:hypothetical protein